jgi:hypothetical protein
VALKRFFEPLRVGSRRLVATLLLRRIAEPRRFSRKLVNLLAESIEGRGETPLRGAKSDST